MRILIKIGSALISSHNRIQYRWLKGKVREIAGLHRAGHQIILVSSGAVAAGMTRAADNGYDNNGTSNDVEIRKCNDPAATCGLPSPLPPLYPNGPADLSSYYIQSTITSTVPTYLAKVVGVTEVTNSVQAVVHAEDQVRLVFTNHLQVIVPAT